MNPIFCILVLLPAAVFCVDCSDKPDGSYDIGCRSFSVCSGGKSQVVNCVAGMTAYSEKTGKCEDIKKIPPPCGVWKDCSSMGDGRYPDLDQDCESYYTCLNGLFFGHNYCPTGLVFNTKLQNCDWAKDVPKPCGTQ